MSSQGIEQLWAVLWDLSIRIARLEGRMEAQDSRQDRAEDEMHKDKPDKLRMRDIIPAIMPAIMGFAVLVMVLMGKLTLAEGVSQLFGR